MVNKAFSVDALEKLLTDSSIAEIEMDELTTYTIEEPLIIKRPVRINGNGASVICKGASAFKVVSSGVQIHSLSISSGQMQVLIDGYGDNIIRIELQNIVFLNYHSAGVCIGSTVSNSSISGVSIDGCRFIKDDPSIDSCNDIFLTSAFSFDGRDIKNTELDDVEICGNLFSGKSCCNIVGVVALCAIPEREPLFQACNIQHITIRENTMSGAYDTAVVHMSNYINTHNCKFDYVEVINNQITFGLTGIASTAAAPMRGTARGVTCRHIRYIGNTIKGIEGGSGEPNLSIAVDAAQLDYYSSSSFDSLLEDVEIRGNTIIGSTYGIMACGAHSMLDADAPCEMKNNILNNVTIVENQFIDVDECFIFSGARIEGRRIDWNWGMDHKMQYWQKPVKDHSLVTMDVYGNEVRNLVCENNKMDGYRYACKITGAWARGHGLFTNNKCEENIVFRNNIGTRGEDHIIVEPTWLEDWAHDGGGNRVDKSIKCDFYNPGAYM